MQTNSNPAVIGSVRSISGTNVSVQLYPSLNSTISYIYGNGYKVGQVGGFVKIPQGFVNLYGTIVQIGADAVPEPMRNEANTGLRWMTVQLVGEGAKGQPFERGISQYPMIDDEVYIVTEDDLVNIYGRENGAEFVPVGTISGAENIPAMVDINKLVTRHSCIVGSTGTGKSTTVAGLVNTLIDSTVFPSSRIILVDIHGEYGGTFKSRANVFRITQTEELLKRQKENSEDMATDTHYIVGKTIREAIKKLGGTMPEDLPMPNKSIKELENEKLDEPTIEKD